VTQQSELQRVRRIGHNSVYVIRNMQRMCSRRGADPGSAKLIGMPANSDRSWERVALPARCCSWAAAASAATPVPPRTACSAGSGRQGSPRSMAPPERAAVVQAGAGQPAAGSAGRQRRASWQDEHERRREAPEAAPVAEHGDGGRNRSHELSWG
jgi:hypothetical protein